MDFCLLLSHFVIILARQHGLLNMRSYFVLRSGDSEAIVFVEGRVSVNI